MNLQSDRRGRSVPNLESADLRFVEAKQIDWERIKRILAASERENHWTNFGPVSRRLEATLAEMLELHSDSAVVVTSSATAALFAIAGVSAAHMRCSVRWVTSAFGFFSTRIGPLASVQFVDCDDSGLLDLAHLAEMPEDSWDGLLVTNVFSARATMADYVQFCRQRGKAIIIDNAMCLLGYDRTSLDAPPEIISFHHTKPWGFGEGGCAVVPRNDVPLVRNLVNFGHLAPPQLSMFAANGKLSELGAAAILQRLEQLQEWAPAYTAQWCRIAEIATAAGFNIFQKPAAGSVIGFVPLLAPRSVSAARIRASSLPMAKYYPLLEDLPNARALYAHVVCVASHANLAALSDAIIEQELSSLLA